VYLVPGREAGLWRGMEAKFSRYREKSALSGTLVIGVHGYQLNQLSVISPDGVWWGI